MKKIRLVCGTRLSREEFFERSALGRSLQLYNLGDAVELLLFPLNAQPLPVIYNAAIEAAASSPALLVFCHDDIHLVDFHWVEKVYQAVDAFAVVGLAGNKRRLPRQPAWNFARCTLNSIDWDDPENLSGVVGHGSGFPCAHISVFGRTGQECKLLDGLMLIADSSILLQHELRFDPRFGFHFYDMDFCRQAERRALRMGTWPICVVHESGGGVGSVAWQQAFLEYLKKYDELPEAWSVGPA